MPEATTVAPETQQAPPAPVAAPETPAVPTPGTDQDAARRALYEKHYGTPSGDTTAPPVTSPAPAAQADTTQDTTATAGVPPEYFTSALDAIRQEFAALRQQMTPAPVAAPTTPAEAEPGWVSLLREGKIAEAEQALAVAIAAKVQGPTVEQAVARATERMQAESEINSFVKDLRSANPELVDMEKFVAVDAQERLFKLQNEGKIKTTEDAVREYKRAVLDATESARKIVQKLRGSGKTEAMVRSREVLSASTISPQQVDAARAQQTTDGEPVQETAESYFEKRKAAESARKGLAQF